MRKLLLAFLLTNATFTTTISQTSVCPNGNTSFTTISGSTYQWQVRVNEAYVNVVNNSNYAGATTSTLQLVNIPSSWNGYAYRCLVDGVADKRFILWIANTWTGGVDTSWANAANWSCNTLPDENTDVIINAGAVNTPSVTSKQICRKVIMNTGSILKLTTGDTLLITGNSEMNQENLDDYDVSILDTIPLSYISLDNVFLPNGMSVKAYLQQNDPGFLVSHPSARMQKVSTVNVVKNKKEKQLDLFITRLLAVGSEIVYDPNFATLTPNLHGIGYMPGGKQYASPQKATDGGCTTEDFYGLDCSGMVYQMTTQAFLPSPIPSDDYGVANINRTAFWDSAFALSSEYDSLGMFDLGKIGISEMRNGDIIFWPRHVGIVLNNSIYQSYGKFDAPECNTNYTDPKRGPRILKLSDYWLGNVVAPNARPPFNSGEYKVFRPHFNTFTDSRDGQIYTIKQIGNDIWMTQNLNYNASGSYCYENGLVNCAGYGRLYDWNTARTVAPSGWKLPTDTDWTNLTNFLGGVNVAGGTMKEEGTSRWTSPNVGATNKSGFKALPAGNKNTFGSNFANIGIRAFWWSSTASTSTQAWNRTLDNASTVVGRGSANSEAGRTHFSVRLIKNKPFVF